MKLFTRIISPFLRITSLFKSIDKNAYLTQYNPGYEWWWHSFIGVHNETNERKPFFIEYYTIKNNPELKSQSIQFQKPSYFMLKAGTWGEDAKEINNYYNLNAVKLDTNKMNINVVNSDFEINANDKHIKGTVMDFANKLTWNLNLNKLYSYDLGYTTNRFSRFFNFAQMYWHIPGVKTEYNGTVIYNNNTYIVDKKTSIGYQDKNWGTHYTDKWVWLNCNHFYHYPNTSIVVGGAIPVVFNIKLFETLIIVLFHNNKKYEFNFSKFWNSLSQKINIYKSKSDKEYIIFQIETENSEIKLNIDFKCDVNKMFKIKYQDLSGNIPHRNLYNGHHGIGKIIIYDKKSKKETYLYGDYAGCEYGEIVDRKIEKK